MRNYEDQPIEISEEFENAFKKAVDSYSDLNWSDEGEGIFVCTPSGTCDLGLAGRVLSIPGLFSYRDRIVKGKSKILIVYKIPKHKDKKRLLTNHYMVIEVVDGKIVQARKNENENACICRGDKFPDYMEIEDDTEWLSKFASEKNLELKIPLTEYFH